MGKQWAIGDALYTVNPEAIRSFDVYTENKRVVCELYTAAFGLVIMVVVGATVVGSINFLPGVHEEGVKVTSLGDFSGEGLPEVGFSNGACFDLTQRGWVFGEDRSDSVDD